VAGPEPDEDGNPVGLVHVAAACRDGRMSHVKRNFGKRSREENRNLSLEVALDLLEAVMRASEEPRKAG
jgi:nicotinamide-nucleotide amidase